MSAMELRSQRQLSEQCFDITKGTLGTRADKRWSQLDSEEGLIPEASALPRRARLPVPASTPHFVQVELVGLRHDEVVDDFEPHGQGRHVAGVDLVDFNELDRIGLLLQEGNEEVWAFPIFRGQAGGFARIERGSPL